MSVYKYDILYYWDDVEYLYVDYLVTNYKNGSQARAIECFELSELKIDYHADSSEEIEEKLLKSLQEKEGAEFSAPKASELSLLLQYVYDFVCESESNMCHIDYDDWEELKKENDFSEEDINTLREEIKKYHLDNCITLDDSEYKICGYGELQCCFNDDRRVNHIYER